MDPYKNVKTLLKALAGLREKCEFQIKLIIAGSPDPRYPEIQDLAERLKIKNIITWSGPVDEEKLITLYQKADLLVHPSLYEGFGLQIAEAMRCGTPVISSNAGSIPEVAGDAAIILDPYDVDGFTEKMQKVLTNNELANEMSRKGLQQAGNFTWHETAKQTLAVYESFDSAKAVSHRDTESAE
jgi:glycosyltransferase involved in cell wall biosynthesis